MPPCRLPLVVLLVLLLQSPSAHAVEWVGSVVGIADGDTLTFLDDGKTPHRIRLDGIDAPERTQDHGQRARESLASMAHGRRAVAACPETDRYGRAVCRVTVDGTDVGLEQIRRGLAWHYVKYANEQSPGDREKYAGAEEQARSTQLGLWSTSTAVPPWDFRRGKAAAK
jgi:endonuclease YncB( thermonuclease family)